MRVHVNTETWQTNEGVSLKARGRFWQEFAVYSALNRHLCLKKHEIWLIFAVILGGDGHVLIINLVRYILMRFFHMLERPLAHVGNLTALNFFGVFANHVSL